jgi:hypothetical protein
MQQYTTSDKSRKEYRNSLIAQTSILFTVSALSFVGGWRIGSITLVTVVALYLLFVYMPFSTQYHNYFEVSNGDMFTYDHYTGTMNYHGKAGQIEFNVTEIKSVVYRLSVATQNGNSGKLAWDPYGYTHFKLLDGRSFFITSLLIPDLGAFLKDSEIDRNKIREIASWMPRLVPAAHAENAG